MRAPEGGLFDGALEDGERGEGGDGGVHGRKVWTGEDWGKEDGIDWRIEGLLLLWKRKEREGAAAQLPSLVADEELKNSIALGCF